MISADFTLRTARLVLRGPQSSDLDAMFALYSDPRAMRYWSTPPHPNMTITRAMLDLRIDDWAQAQLYFQISREGQYIGNAGNYRDNEIGFILHPDHWRQGIATETLRAIIPHLWKTTRHTALTADADPLNGASVGLLESLGFGQTHQAKNTFCINGVWSDSVYFALPRPMSQP